MVDSGNHRVLHFDGIEFGLREVWGQDDVAATPVAGSAPGYFDTPWTISVDGDGYFYVLDYGNHRIQKFRNTGEPDLKFAAALQQSGLIPHPGALAVSGKGANVAVFVFDMDGTAIFVFDGTGAPVRDGDGNPAAIRYPGMTKVLALAAGPDVVCAGDNALERVLAFAREPGFPFSGEASGYGGPSAAITIDAGGGIAVNPGSGAPVSLTAAGAFLPFGVLWSDAISSGADPGVWNRLRADVQNADGAHIEFFYSTSNSAASIPVQPASAQPFSDPKWIALPNDVEDFLLTGDKAYFLFVGAVFSGDRSVTPRLRQMRADFDNPGYLPSLPAIYREPQANAEFLRQFLALFQGVFDDIEGELDALPRYFNPYAAPAEALPWLASWLAVDLDQGEPVSRIRTAIALAFRRFQWRGTAEGLRLALLEDAGVHANIVQPIVNASFWAFAGDTACSGVPSTPSGVQLGNTSTLPDMQPGGAVLGSTAQLDHSYLITDAEFGQPLFDGLADQFVVEVYRSEVSGKGRLEQVRAIVEREKPAHTMWRLSEIDASMRVGFEARVGIDSIIAGISGPTGLGSQGSTAGLRLAGPAAPRTGSSRLGDNLKLEQ